MKMMSLKISYILICFLILASNINSYAVEKWVECKGEAAIQNITHEEAQLIAKRKARLDAIEKVCGVQLQSETLVKDFVMAGDFIHSISYGQVVEERNIQWETENIPSQDSSSPPVVLLKIAMQARVAVSEDKPDPSFRIESKINRSTFQSGDEAVITIQATQDCFITIFNIAANDSVYILFPNEHFSTPGFLKAGKKYEIPNKRDRKSNMSIRVATLPGHKKDTEIVKIVATKKEIKFPDYFKRLNQYGLIGTPKVAVQQIAKWLVSIPVSERAEAAMMYTIESD